MFFLMDHIIFVEIIGYLSLTIEAFLGFPQLLKNYQNKSTLGMSHHMVLLWTGGDLFKTGYFLVKKVPKQFIICGILQVSIDLMILAQISFYRKNNSQNASLSHRNNGSSSASSQHSVTEPLRRDSIRTCIKS